MIKVKQLVISCVRSVLITEGVIPINLYITSIDRGYEVHNAYGDAEIVYSFIVPTNEYTIGYVLLLGQENTIQDEIEVEDVVGVNFDNAYSIVKEQLKKATDKII